MALYDEAYVATQRARIRELEAELEHYCKEGCDCNALRSRAEKAEARVAELEARYCPDPNVRLHEAREREAE